MNEEQQKQWRAYQESVQRQQQEDFVKFQRAQQQHVDVQNELNNRPNRKYAAIVAVDLRGGFSKDGQIPWHYSADFKWFQTKTKGNVCVMGRTTYDDIDKRLGEKAAENVLPNRKTFVVTSRPLARSNATPIASMSELDFQLDRQNIPYDQTVFFCGGERIYLEGMSKADIVYMTVVNKDVDADKFFPNNLLQTDFQTTNIEKVDDEPDLRFITFTRKSQ